MRDLDEAPVLDPHDFAPMGFVFVERPRAAHEVSHFETNPLAIERCALGLGHQLLTPRPRMRKQLRQYTPLFVNGSPHRLHVFLWHLEHRSPPAAKCWAPHLGHVFGAGCDTLVLRLGKIERIHGTEEPELVLVILAEIVERHPMLDGLDESCDGSESDGVRTVENRRAATNALASEAPLLDDGHGGHPLVGMFPFWNG